MLVKISARSSHLARLQAYQVGEALEKVQPDIKIEYFFRESLGDKNLIDPLWKMPEKGVFTEDFYSDLVNEETDLVVHSWKDLPTERRDETYICATLPRADQRDLLLVKKSSLQKMKTQQSINIFSSSQRRVYNLEKFLLSALPFQMKRIQFESVRGNIPTRLEKLITSETADGLILAKAAVDRLLTIQHPDFTDMQDKIRKVLDACEFMVLPLCENPNAAAQGALAIEIKKSRTDLLPLLQKINAPETFQAVQKEREVLASYGGGCHQKIGVAFLPRPYGMIQILKGQTDAGEVLDVFQIEGESKSVTESSKLKKMNVSYYRDLFQRQEIQIQISSEINAVFVSRISAYVPFDGFRWTSGLTTWKKLAAQDVWVHGCAESLGEQEEPRIDILAQKKLNWAKLTHLDAVDPEASIKNIATYQINLGSDLPAEIKTAENFFWMSAFQFDAVAQKYPELYQKRHCCGPGRTYQQLTQRLSAYGNRPYIFLNEKEWKKQ